MHDPFNNWTEFFCTIRLIVGHNLGKFVSHIVGKTSVAISNSNYRLHKAISQVNCMPSSRDFSIIHSREFVRAILVSFDHPVRSFPIWTQLPLIFNPASLIFSVHKFPYPECHRLDSSVVILFNFCLVFCFSDSCHFASFL